MHIHQSGLVGGQSLHFKLNGNKILANCQNNVISHALYKHLYISNV